MISAHFLEHVAGGTMKQNRQKKKTRHIIAFLFLAVMILGGAFAFWLVRPENVQTIKSQISAFLFGDLKEGYYNAKSLVLVDRSDDSIFISKRETEQHLPASLAKLFVVEYASTIADLTDTVFADPEAIASIKPNSSVANLEAKNYSLQNLFAAMLVPSGNDAAYVVADYCGGILSPEAKTCQERISVFMDSLNQHLQELGYHDTVLYDPSGFDTDARTTALDMKSVVDRLLEHDWFREIISQSTYTAKLPDGSTQTWKNTNTFLDPESEYYHENVIGVKTGSLSGDYNLVVLYQQHGKEFLICSFGSESDSARYDDVDSIIKTIDESNYLSQ